MLNRTGRFSFVISLVAPLLSLALVVISSAPFMTFVSVRMEVGGYSETIIGLVHSSFYGGFLLGSTSVEKLMHRIGYIRSFAAFASLYAASVLIQSLYLDPILWMVMRLLGGLSIAGLYIVIESWLLVESSAKVRGRVFSFYMIILYGSQSISQLLIQSYDITTLIPYIVAGLFATVSVIPLSVTYTKSPEYSCDAPKKSIKEIYKSAPLGFSGAIVAGFVLSAIYSFVPNFAHFQGISVSYIMMITIGGGFVLQWPLGYLSDIFDRRNVLIGIAIAISIPALLILFFPASSSLVLILSFFLGGFAFTLYPISITQVCDRVDSIYVPYVTGVLSLFYGIGAVIGPLIAPPFMEIFHPPGLYFYISLSGLLLALSGFYYKWRYPREVAVVEKHDFVTTSATTPVGAELDPRVAGENWESEPPIIPPLDAINSVTENGSSKEVIERESSETNDSDL